MKRGRDGHGQMFYTDHLSDEDVLLSFTDPDEWLSRRQLADRVWRKVTPSLAERLERLVGEGKLAKQSINLTNGMKMFFYQRAREK